MKWQEILRTNFRAWKEIAHFLEVPVELAGERPDFPLNVPRRLADKMVKGDGDDPLLRQFLPTAIRDDFSRDPVGDLAARKAPRLLHKYRGRALLVVTSACAMHCRYCFRQHFSYASGAPSFHEELTTIAADPTIHEVILSGGDPLSLSNRQLGQLIQGIEAIPHVQRLRFHSRFPIGIPERIDEELCQLLEGRLQVFFVVHINHARELDEEIIEALKRLKVPLLNQSVLLRGVNDDVETLAALSEALVDAGILPYYLHQLDQVAGAAHFEVSENEGLALIDALNARLPGYAIPRYVREIEGETNKVYIRSTDCSPKM